VSVSVVAIAENLTAVRAGLAKAARAVGRQPGEVTLIAVSKTHGPDAVRAALAAGQRHFGENKVQEAMAKWTALKAQAPDAILHLIGPLQTNKVADAVALFDVVHTVDRPKLAAKLAAEMAKQGRPLPCFIQVNTGREAQKAGVDPAEVDGFIRSCREDHKLDVVGLMCIPPLTDDPAPHFAFLRELARRNNLAQLSMGMSGDAAQAVRLGATHVRVGTAIFGARTAAQSTA
jgi:hypothetical protein